MTKDLKYLIKIVKQAAKMVTDEFMINAKDENNDLITDFDIEIEKFLLNKLNSRYPDFKIISEEFNASEKETANYFTIDPIDGTINFAHGLSIWGIQVAMVKDYKTVASVLYFPKLNELYYADETGAYLNGGILDLNKVNYPSKPLIDQIYLDNENDFCEEFTKDIPSHLRARMFRKFYCAAASYCWIAKGGVGAFIFAKHLPWDYTPGMFLVERANGVTSTFEFNNKPYYIAAVNQKILDNVISAIKSTQKN